jgi:hypothetical protein
MVHLWHQRKTWTTSQVTFGYLSLLLRDLNSFSGRV